MQKSESALLVRELIALEPFERLLAQAEAGLPIKNFYDPVIRGQLKNTQPCMARLRRVIGFCTQPAMANGRCRIHGGKSTGPKTEAGKRRAAQANLRHGEFTAEVKEAKRQATMLLRDGKALVQEIAAHS